jgi:hypothetical protein
LDDVGVECFTSKIVTQNYPDKKVGNCVGGVNGADFTEGPFKDNEGRLSWPEVEKCIFIDFAYMEEWGKEENDERKHNHKEIFVKAMASGDEDESNKDEEY